MHSFLSKVFGRKKDDKDVSPTQLSPGELLGERFEAISPNVSPSATNFLELDPKVNSVGESSKDPGFSLFRAKSRPSSPEAKSKRHDTLPQLSLAFLEANGPRSPAADFLREADPDMSVMLSDAIIGQRRLNPLEALILIRACSQAIIARGLTTLGVMHPHWYSASPDVQRRLISQFINSLNADSTTSPTSGSPTTAFESEMTFTRPHDVAAVLRWGLRHLQLDGDQLGKDEDWYTKFLESEAAADYPLKAFSEQLAPHLPPAHLEVLTSTLEIFSSLAAHAEANSTSGSKLSKIFGLWLLVSQRVDSKDDFHAFYQRWERMGRMLEHLFLARIRDDSADRRMPVRLLELVRQYPYTKGLSNPMTDVKLLARPRITTIPYDALFVRLEVELPSEMRRPKHKINPLTLLADAFSLQVEGEHAELWTIITSESKHGSSPSPLSNVFADETIRFLSMVPGMDAAEMPVKSPSLSIFAGGMLSAHRRSATAIEKGKGKPAPTVVSGHVKPATDPTPVSALSPLDLTQDWDQFSTSGFFEVSPAIVPLASTLLDNDVEKTVPPDPPAPISLSRSLSRRSSKSKRSRHAKSPSTTSPRKSEETIRPTPIAPSSAAPTPPLPQQDTLPLTKASRVQIIQIDEAFVDFWSDALLDPMSSDWPTFVICKFKTSLLPKLVIGIPEEGQTAKVLKYLILEHIHTVKPPLPPIPVEVARPRASSPSSESMSPKKRFSFWSMNRSLSGSSVGSPKGKNKLKSPVAVGEMGELLEEGGGSSSSSKSPISRIRQSLDISRKPSESPTLKKAESMAAIKESAPFASGAAAVAIVSAISPDEGNKDDSQAPQAQETVEEVKPEELAEEVAIPSVDNSALSQDEQAVVISNADQSIESQSSDETPALKISESSAEISEQSQATEQDAVVSSAEIPVILEETSISQQEDTAVHDEPTVSGGSVLEPLTGGAEVANTPNPEEEEEESAGPATHEPVQIDTTLPSEVDEQHLASSQDHEEASGININNTLEEEQVEVAEDVEQQLPPILASVEETALAEHIVTSFNEESASPPADQSDDIPTSDHTVEQVVEEPMKEDISSPDSTFDESLNTDRVEDTRGLAFDSENVAIPPTEEDVAIADVNTTELHDVTSLEEPAEAQTIGQADPGINTETTLAADANLQDSTEPMSIVELQHVHSEAVIMQRSFAEHVMQDLPQADAVQEPVKASEQDLPLTEEVITASSNGATQVESVQEIDTPTPTSDTELLNNDESSRVVIPTEGAEVNQDTQEIIEDIPITEASSSEENRDDIEPPSILETVDEANISIEQGSTQVHNDEVDTVAGPEHHEIVELVQTTSAEQPTSVALEETYQAQEDITDAETAGETEPVVVVGNLETEGIAEVQHHENEVVLPQESSEESATQGLAQADAVRSSETSEQDLLAIVQVEEANPVEDTEPAHVQDTEPYIPASHNDSADNEPLGGDASATEHIQVVETLFGEESKDDIESVDDRKSTIEEVSPPTHTDTVAAPEYSETVDSMQVDPVEVPSVVVLEEASQAEVQAHQDTASGNEVSENPPTPVITDSAEIESAHEADQEAPTEHGAHENDPTETPPSESPEQHEPPSVEQDQVEIFQEEEQPSTLDTLTEQSSVPPGEEQSPQVHDGQVATIPESAANVEEGSGEQLKEAVADVDNKLTTDPKEDNPPFSVEANDGKSAVEVEGVLDASSTGALDIANVALIEPTQPEGEAQDNAVAGDELSTNKVVTADPLPIHPAEIASAAEVPFIEAPTDIQTEAPPSEQSLEAHTEGVLNDIQPPHVPTILDHGNSDLVKQDVEPQPEEVSVQVHNEQVDANPTPVLDVKQVADESLEELVLSSGAVSSEYEHTKDATANTLTSSPEFNDQTTHVEEDEVIGNPMGANAVEIPADTPIDENAQSQTLDAASAEISQGGNILQEPSAELVDEIDAAPVSEMADKVEEVYDVDISAEHHTEIMPDAKQAVEGIPEEFTPEALAEQSATPQPEECTSVHEDLAVIPKPDPDVEDTIDQQLTEDTVVGDSANGPIETIPEQSVEVASETAPSEKVEDTADMTPIASPVDDISDEAPASQIPEQEETVVNGINDAEVIDPITMSGAETESVAEDPQQVEKETVLQESLAELDEAIQGGNSETPNPANETEFGNDEGLSHGDSATELIESTLDPHETFDAVQVPETLPSEDKKGDVESAAIVETREQVNSSTEEESAPPQTQAQEDIASDNETFSSLTNPVAAGITETEDVTELHHDNVETTIAQESSTELSIPDDPQVSVVQPSEQDLVHGQEHEECTVNSTEVEAPQHMEQHTLDTAAEPINNEGLSSETEASEVKEVLEDVHIASPVQESKGETESSATSEHLDEVIIPSEEKPEPVEETPKPQSQAQGDSAPDNEIPSVTPAATGGAEIDSAPDVHQEEPNVQDTVLIDAAPPSDSEVLELHGMEQANSSAEEESAPPHIQAQEDIAGDNETFSSLTDPVAAGLAEIEDVTELHHDNAETTIAQESSTEPSIPDDPLVSIVQPSEQDLVQSQEHEEGTVDSTEVEVPQHLEQHALDTTAEPINNERPSSETEASEVKEVSEDVHIVSPTEESKGETESFATSELLDEVILPSEEKSEPVEVVMVSKPEHKSPVHLTQDDIAESPVDTVLEETALEETPQPQSQAQGDSAPDNEIPHVTPAATGGAEIDSAPDVHQEEPSAQDTVLIDAAPPSDSEVHELHGMGGDSKHNEGEEVNDTHETPVPELLDEVQPDIVVEEVAEEQIGESHVDEETLQSDPAPLVEVTEPIVLSSEQHSESDDNDGPAESTQVDLGITPTDPIELSSDEHLQEEIKVEDVEETSDIPIVHSQVEVSTPSSAEAITTPVVETPGQEVVESMTDTPLLVHHEEELVNGMGGDHAAHESTPEPVEQTQESEPQTLTPDEVPLEVGQLEAENGLNGVDHDVAESAETVPEIVTISAISDSADDVAETPITSEENEDPIVGISKTAIHAIQEPIVADDDNAGISTETELTNDSLEITTEA